eukprot:282115_1
METINLIIILCFHWYLTRCSLLFSKHDKFCASGSILLYINGIYEFYSWNDEYNGSIYHNSDTNQYLYPWIYTNVNKQYLISDNPKFNTVSSYCPINNPLDMNAFNLNACRKGWISVSNGWVNDDSMRIVDCYDICVSQNDQTHLNGIYIWHHFELTMNSSIYYCADCDTAGFYGAYLFYYQQDNEWRIDNDYRSNTAISKCIVTNSNIYDVAACIHWKTFDDINWYNDTDLSVLKCPPEPSAAPTLSPIFSTECIEPELIMTVTYGGGGNAFNNIAINQGIINGITSWGIENNELIQYQYHGISKMQFMSNNKSVIEYIFGADGVEFCASFWFDYNNDYINGYRIIYGQYIHGLIFYTMRGNAYECIANFTDLVNGYNDTGNVYYNNSYLSGFYVNSGGVIDSIAFQLTSLKYNNHYECKYILFTEY